MLSYFLAKYILYPLFYRKDKTLSSLLREFEVPILVFANADYSQAASSYNLRLSHKPEVIALPQTVAQVRTAQNWLRCLVGLLGRDRYKPQSDAHKGHPRKSPRVAVAIVMQHLVSVERTGVWLLIWPNSAACLWMPKQGLRQSAVG